MFVSHAYFYSFSFFSDNIHFSMSIVNYTGHNHSGFREIILCNSVFKEALQSFNYGSLYKFLDSFKNIYEYCNLFYDIEKDFVDRMIEEGKMPILTSEDLSRYMNLAEEFWRIQGAISAEWK